jgi:hypothetical protein
MHQKLNFLLKRVNLRNGCSWLLELIELGVSISITERRQGGDKGLDEFPCAEKEREGEDWC